LPEIGFHLLPEIPPSFQVPTLLEIGSIMLSRDYVMVSMKDPMRRTTTTTTTLCYYTLSFFTENTSSFSTAPLFLQPNGHVRFAGSENGKVRFVGSENRKVRFLGSEKRRGSVRWIRTKTQESISNAITHDSSDERERRRR
ncbi:hypothetical protein L195_g055556, partial [Trifolium pratense]